MKLRERITKKFILTKVVPVVFFLIVTTSVFVAYSTKLRHGTTALL